MQGGQRRVGEHACEAPGELDQGQSCEPAQDELCPLGAGACGLEQEHGYSIQSGQ